jgi:hypothetical protein
MEHYKIMRNKTYDSGNKTMVVGTKNYGCENNIKMWEQTMFVGTK